MLQLFVLYTIITSSVVLHQGSGERDGSRCQNVNLFQQRLDSVKGQNSWSTPAGLLSKHTLTFAVCHPFKSKYISVHRWITERAKVQRVSEVWTVNICDAQHAERLFESEKQTLL